MSDATLVVSNVVMALATFVIAIYSWRSYSLSKEIKKLSDNQADRESQFRIELKDLYKAIVISNLPCAGGSVDDKLKDFVRFYKDRHNYFGEIFEAKIK